MGIDHGLAAIEFLEHRHESGIAEIFVAVAGEQPDAVGLEHVERIFDFAQAAFGVGQRYGGEQAELAGIILAQLRAVVVAFARQRARFFDIAEPDAGLHHAKAPRC